MTLPRPPEATGAVFRSDRDVVICDATLDEQYRDAVSTTDQRVEEGVPVSDHSNREPLTYSCTAHFTDTPLGQQGVEGRAQAAHDVLLNGMRSFQLWRITTGRRVMRNMLLVRCDVSEEAPAKECLDLALEFKEIRRVSRQSVLLPAEVTSEDPDRTTGNQETGPQNADQATQTEGETAASAIYVSNLYRGALSPEAALALEQTPVSASPQTSLDLIYRDLFSGGINPLP